MSAADEVSGPDEPEEVDEEIAEVKKNACTWMKVLEFPTSIPEGFCRDN